MPETGQKSLSHLNHICAGTLKDKTEKLYRTWNRPQTKLKLRVDLSSIESM